MTVDTIIEQAGIPLLLLVICVCLAMPADRFALTVRRSAGKISRRLKDEEAYCKAGGKLLLFFGAATFLMAILVFVNVYVAVAEIIICTVILGILWKRMEDQYGG